MPNQKPRKNPKPRSYKTNADLFSFGRYLLSDERRHKFQKIAKQKHDDEIINFTPWTVAIRFIHDFDYDDWMVWREKYDTNEKPKTGIV